MMMMAREFLYFLFCTKCDQKMFDQLNRLTRTNTIMRCDDEDLKTCCADAARAYALKKAFTQSF